MHELAGRARTPLTEIASYQQHSHPGKGERQVSILIDIPAALVASPRPCAPLAGARLHADDAAPRLRSRSEMTVAAMAWRHGTGSTKRGFESAAKRTTQDGRTAFTGVAYVTANQHFSIRSGPPTSRQPA
jgi:hypothetical protein